MANRYRVLFTLNCTGTPIDVSNDVDLRTYTRDVSLDGNNDPQRSVSGEITITGDAYTLVYNHLVDNVNLYSNSICVEITDLTCSVNNTNYFTLDNKTIRWCDNDLCELQMTLIEKNVDFECIIQTLIADNWDNRFDTNLGTIDHPQFRYCDIIKPTFFFGALVTIANAIDVVIVTINAITSIVGIGAIPTIANQILGCGRFHPSAFLRTYISNVCDKCGIAVDATSSPILYDTLSRYYNLTMMAAQNEKGHDDPSNTKRYLLDNAPNMNLFQLKSKLKDVFNARWYIKNSTLYFNRKDLLGNIMYGVGVFTIDLTNDEDYKELIGDVCYEWNGEGKPNLLYVKYGSDSTDVGANGYVARFDGEQLISGNPNYTATIERALLDFGRQQYVLDGRDTIWDANVNQAVGSTIDAGVLKMDRDTPSLYKLIIYDTASPLDDAMAVGISYDSPFATNGSYYNGDEGAFFPISFSALRAMNYPMWINPDAHLLAPNLWEFHQIDLPNPSKKTNIGFTMVMNYCCKYSTLDLFMKVKFKDGSLGEILQLTFNNEAQTITIKGNKI